MSVTHQFVNSNSRKAITKVGFFLLSLVIISFAYELPILNITGRYRTNLRLFDIAAIVLFLYWIFAGKNRGWSLSLQSPIIKPWFWLTMTFAFAGVTAIIFVPFDKYLYSIFYMLKYFEVLIVILIFAAVPFDEKSKERLLWVALLASVWTSGYAFLQYFDIVSKARYLPNNEEIPSMVGALNSTLGNNYFHLGMYSILSGLVGFSLLSSAKRFFPKLIAIGIIGMNVAAATLCGSKAALLGMVMAIGLLILLGKNKSKVGVLIVGILALGVLYNIFSGSLVKDRLEEGHGGTPMQRLAHGPKTIVEAFDTHGVKMLVFGGGFYVVPLNQSNGGTKSLKYRIGYGNHNIYLFPLEQGGLLAFGCALWFWFSTFFSLRRNRRGRSRKDIDFTFSSAMYIFIIVLMIVGVAGQVFFIGFNTEHFTAYILLMFIISMKKTIGIGSSGQTKEAIVQTPLQKRVSALMATETKELS